MYVRKQYVQILNTIISFYCLEKYKKNYLASSVVDPDQGFGIRCFFDPWIRIQYPRRGKSRSGIWDEHPGSYFRELKILKFFYADPGSFRPWNRDPGWKTLDLASGINIPDPQHCWQGQRGEQSYSWVFPEKFLQFI
jgi:hypothetical protein